MKSILQSKILRKIVTPTILILACIGIMFASPRIKVEESTTDTMLTMQKTPVNAKLIKPFLFGHEAFYADLFWIHSVRWSVETGIPNLFEFLEKMVDVTTDLDPRFEQVYIWAGLMLNYSSSVKASYKEKIEATNRILLKGWNYIQSDTEGWNHFPNYWMIPEILAYNYGIELKDNEKALEYTRALMTVPGLPSHMKTWAAILLKDEGKVEEGTQFMEDLLAIETLHAQMNMTDDEIVRDNLKGKLLMFYNKMEKKNYANTRIAQIQKQITDLVDTWKTSYQFLPFRLYTLLHVQESSAEYEQGQAMYSIFFPTLGGLQ